MAAQNPALIAQLSTHIQTTLSLHPSTAYLSSLLSSLQNPNLPLPALQRTVQFRLLASSITQSLYGADPNTVGPENRALSSSSSSSSSTTSTVLPADVHDPHQPERRLAGPVALQLLDIEDVGTSRMAQIEVEQDRLENLGRAERFRIVSVDEPTLDGDELQHHLPPPQQQQQQDDGVAAPAGGGGGGGGTQRTSKGPHKLLLQDAAGRTCYGLEMEPLPGVRVGMEIGCKLVVRDGLLARGLLLLDRRCATVLGGRVEALDRVWRQAWLGRVQDSIAYRGRDSI